MTFFQPGANLYTQGFGSRPENIEVPFMASRAPTATDINFPVGKRWLYVSNAEYVLLNFTSTGNVLSANWQVLAAAAGTVATLTGDTGTATPSAGNIKIAGTASEITTAASGAQVTLSLPSAITAPGSLTTTTTLAATTTVTGGTGVIATTGNITATAGEVIAGGDTGGVASTVALTNTSSSTISTGVGSVKMSTANPATNTEWLKIYIGTSAFWVPAWTTNAP